MKYIIMNQFNNTSPLDSYEETLEEWKDRMLGEGVSDDDYIEVHAFDESKGETEEESYPIKRFNIVVNEERMKTSTPKEEGYVEWDYWAKWEEVSV